MIGPAQVAQGLVGLVLNTENNLGQRGVPYSWLRESQTLKHVQQSLQQLRVIAPYPNQSLQYQ